MFIGMLIGLLIGIVVVLLAMGPGELGWNWEGWQRFLFGIAIVLILVIIFGGVGILIDRYVQAEYIATWDITRTSYEQAMNTYDNYESVVKDNLDLIKEAITKNTELAQMKYQATRWWYFYLDDSIANLQPINIGTN